MSPQQFDELAEQAMLAADTAVLVARDAIGLRARLLSCFPDVDDAEWSASMGATRQAIHQAVEGIFTQALEHRQRTRGLL